MKLLLFFTLILLTFSTKLKTKDALNEQINSYSLFDNSFEQGPTTVASRPTSTVPTATLTKVIKEGWLQLSSTNTISTRKYPFIPLGNDNFAKVDTVRKVLNNTIADMKDQGKSTVFRKNQHHKVDPSVPNDSSFYFRISGLNLYYTETQKDMIVLGAMAVENIISPSTSKLGTNCFRIMNKEKDRWDLCAKDATEQRAWVCAISSAMGRPCEGPKQTGPLVINEKRIVKEPMILIPLPSPVCNEDWNYGDKNWNCKCSEGFEQSPINVERRCVSNINETASFEWFRVRTDRLALFYEENMMKLKCKYEGVEKKNCIGTNFAKIIDSDYTEYDCPEMRFHTPAEHTIEGRKFDLEIQLICNPTSEGDYKKKAAIAFLALQGPGKNNKFLDGLDLMSLPNVYQLKMEWNRKLIDVEMLDVEELLKDADDVYEYNGFFNYWRYIGSLTSPPCDEHVRWFIVEKPVHVGYTALSMIKDVLQVPVMQAPQADGTSKFVADLNSPKNPDGNARDTMPIRDRGILYYDAKASNCAPLPVRVPIKGSGHYEKVPRKADTFIWVKGDKPSGIEGSFVVPEWEAKGLDSPEDQRENDVQNVAKNNE